MNSCILLAKIIRSPELRYTQDTQTPFAQMLVEFAGTRPEEAAATLKVVAWGGLGTEVSQTYQEGDQVIIEGRLSINTQERPEGFKEKRAELVVSKIFRLDTGLQEMTSTTPSPAVNNDNLVSLEDYKSKQAPEVTPPSSGYTAFVDEGESMDSDVFKPLVPVASSEENLDDIPF
jgi:single-stranded DNA-binding protein